MNMKIKENQVQRMHANVKKENSIYSIFIYISFIFPAKYLSLV